MKQFKTLIIGTGGASRAVVHTLADLGTPMIILNRSPGKARLLAGEVGAQWGPLSTESLPLLEAQGGVELAIQTTPAGMHPLEHINPVSWWNPAGLQLACDLIYEPAETLFLKQAREAGVPTLNGDAMLEAQARRQFELFTKL